MISLNKSLSKSKLERGTQKIKEWIIATRLERRYTKEEILTMYFNEYDFLNQAIEIQTNQTAENLMHALLAIESQMGRVRLQKWEPRIIDLDIIFYESAIHTTDFIQIPHPEMQNRAFVLKPLLDLIPNFEHPILKQTISQLWEKCPDQLEVSLFVE